MVGVVVKESFMLLWLEKMLDMFSVFFIETKFVEACFCGIICYLS